jgi:hypothetical protein
MDLDKELEKYFEDTVNRHIFGIIDQYCESSECTYKEAFANKNFIDGIHETVISEIDKFKEKINLEIAVKRWFINNT